MFNLELTLLELITLLSLIDNSEEYAAATKAIRAQIIAQLREVKLKR